ncbi:cupin domain-containing protein [Planotetraspora sp. GP83]|uniref:cupin domain-containing protein n=1 Tax=Planotetraspora sp. GP83 TaxID=3156264 RepID=UPI003515077C
MTTTTEPGRFFPEFIRALPEADIPIDGVSAWMTVDKGLALFFELPGGSQSPDHTHGDEWGLVIRGQVDITIDGVTTSYKAGDTYFVGEGVVHSVVNHPGLIGITVFDGTDRFAPKR